MRIPPMAPCGHHRLIPHTKCKSENSKMTLCTPSQKFVDFKLVLACISSLPSLPEVMPKGTLFYEPIEPRCKSANTSTLCEETQYKRDTISLPGQLDDVIAQCLQTDNQSPSPHLTSARTIKDSEDDYEESEAINSNTHVRDEVNSYEGTSNDSDIQTKEISASKHSLLGQLDEIQCDTIDVGSSQIIVSRSPTEGYNPEQSNRLSSAQQIGAQSILTSTHHQRIMSMEMKQGHKNSQAERRDEEAFKATSNIDTQVIVPTDNDNHSYCVSEMSLSWATQHQDQDSITLSENLQEDGEIIPSSPAQCNMNQAHELPPLSKMRQLNQRQNRDCGYFASLLAYSVCAIMVYPLLIILLPILLVLKLLCCIPCRRCYAGKQTFSTPLFFAQQKAGGYYVIATILKERLDPNVFVHACVSSLNDAYSNHERGFVLKLSSTLKKVACFLSWEATEELQLDQHIVTLKQRITTNKDLAYLLGELSNVEKNGKLWMVYYLPLYKGTQSAVIVQVHHSIASGSDLKNTLFKLLQISTPEQTELKDYSLPKKPSALRAIIKAPGLVLKQLSLRPGQRLSGKPRFAISSPFFLSQAYQAILTANCSLDSLFLGCLTIAFRKYFTHQRKSLQNVVFAIPETFQSPSAYFVTLPVAKKYSIPKLLQKLNSQIVSKSEDAYILSFAGRLSMISLPRYITDAFARSAIKGAMGMFVLIDCTSEPLFLDHHFVSSVLAWPPLFNNFKMSIVVVCYQNFFRICVATDQTECEWPEFFLNQYLAAFDDVYLSLIH